VFEFPWTPKWAVPGSSLWCIASKIAYAATTSTGAVLEQLVGATAYQRLPVHAPDHEVAAQVVAALELGCDREQLFTRLGRLTYADRQGVRLALKWCPQCAEHWFHSPTFQLTGVTYCPWHRCRLLDYCPHCHRGVDPLGPLVWRCSACHRLLTPEPTDWLRDFKKAPGHDGAVPAELLNRQRTYEDNADSEAWLCHPDDSVQLPPEHVPATVHEHWHLMHAFEESCALWDTVLADHRRCVLEEPHPFRAGYSIIEFKCPVAAAATAAFESLGLRIEPKGDWLRGRSSHLRVNLAHIYREPAWLRGVLMRELTRATLFDALEVFGRVARVGRWRTRWSSPENLAVWSSTPTHVLRDVARVSPRVSFSALVKALNFAAESCVHFQDCQKPHSGASF